MAKAEPKHGASAPSPYDPHRLVTFNASGIYKFFSQKTTHFLTIKDNAQRRFVKMDQVRRLIGRCYGSYVIVGSPIGGRHWHVLASDNEKLLKVPRGIHLKRSTVGRLEISKANRKPRENPLSGDAGIYSQLRYVHNTTPGRKSVFRGQNDLSTVVMYMMENLLENPTKNYYEHMAIRW